MITRDILLDEAYSWIRTPHHWQASLKGQAADCKGFVVGCARELGMPEAQSRWSLMRNYQRVDCDLLLHGLRETLDEIALRDRQPGDVLLMRMGGKAQHLGILGREGLAILHTYSRSRLGVVANTYAAVDRVYPVERAFAWKSIA